MCGATKGGLSLDGVNVAKEAVIQGQVLRNDQTWEALKLTVTQAAIVTLINIVLIPVLLTLAALAFAAPASAKRTGVAPPRPIEPSRSAERICR